jgi:hypothetical protein
VEPCQAYRQYAKTVAGEKREERVTAQLAGIGNNPALVRSFFKHSSVAYISDL